MSYRIFVENQEVDTGGDFSAQFTYTIDDIKDFSSRNTKFSKVIILPGTGNNNKVFGNIFEVGNANFHNASTPNVGYNFNAAKSAGCLITQDSIPIFKGVIRVMEIIIDKGRIEYETAVFGELGGLVSAVGDKKLEDLNFASLNHTFTMSNIQASWSATTGYYYPLIDYGYTLDGKIFPVQTFRPAIYVKDYIDKIFQGAGYTYESTFFNTNFFKRLIVPFNGLFPTIDVAQVFNLSRGSSFSTITNAPRSVPFTSTTFPLYLEQNFENTIFTYNREQAISVQYTIQFTTSISFGTFLSVRLLKNGLQVFNTSYNSNGVKTLTGTLELNPGDYISLQIARTSGSGSASISLVNMKLEGQPTVKIPLGINDLVSVNEFIPKDVLQKDFLVWLVKMFNLYIDEDKDKVKHLTIEPFYSYYDSSTSIDWEQKIDHNQPIKIKPMGELNSRLYEFKYKDDSDYYNDYYKKKFGTGYGNFSFDSGYEFAKDKQTVEIGFSASPLVQYSGSEIVATSIQKRGGNSIERTASNIRILSRGAANISLTNHNLIITYNGSTIGTYSNYPYAGHLDSPDAPTTDLSFGVPAEFYFKIVTGYLSGNLYNIFWSYYLSEIVDKDSKVLTAAFKLSPVDIYQLDFSKPIHVLGQRWRLNSVLDYSTDQPDLTKCELLKVIDLE
jgi:hypothetical protein